MRHYCTIPGCDEPGRHAVTLRIRRPDASAIAAPNTNAWLCDMHAESGLEVDVRLKPNKSRTIETYTWAEVKPGVEGHVERSVTRIEPGKATQRASGEAGANNGGRSIARPIGRRGAVG
jgi:hypothetical protein